MDNICERCYHNYVCDEYNADRDFPHKVCAYHNSHFIDAADVVEVRHGRWKNGGNGLYDTCTACGEEIYLAIPMNYCPLCGVRMDKEDEYENQS